jgi:hypothetical protein
MIASLRIAEVVHGTCDTVGDFSSKEDVRYRHAKERGIFHPLKNPCSFSLKTIFERVQRNQETFRKRFEKKMSSEAQHYKQKYSTSAKG